MLFFLKPFKQIAAFIGLGLTFWGAIFAVARNGKYIESSLLDGARKISLLNN